ncbi:unnamed protein product [Boreogadus saida]
MAKVSMTQETVEGRLTDFPLEVSLMLRAAEDRPDPGGPGAPVVHSRNKSKKNKETCRGRGCAGVRAFVVLISREIVRQDVEVA